MSFWLRMMMVISAFGVLAGMDAQAGVSIGDKDGAIVINVSGSDGSGGWGGSGSSGGDGDDAGQISLKLSYADADKTVVQVQADARSGRGEKRSLNKTYNVNDLKSIQLIGLGGDGGNGSSGADGRDGSDGRDGQDGCHPTDGQPGGDGQDGGHGGNGGDGGNGGVVRVETAAEQSELLLFVRTNLAAGRGGSGGSGGRGGRGGDGGDGGDGRCTDSEGKPVHTWDGRDGSDGRSGSDGSSGYGGNDGRSPSKTFDLKTSSGVVSYGAPFELNLVGAKVVDSNADGVLEPGEDLNVTAITVANEGPMPTPLSQVLKVLIKDGQALIVRTSPKIALTEMIAGKTSKTLTFAQGEFVLQARKESSVVGEAAAIAAQFRINNVGRDENAPSSMTVRRPLTMSVADSSVSAYFGSARNYNMTLKNVSAKALGAAAGRLIEVEYSWVSSNVPGADVTVKTKDGKTFTLAQPFVVSDLELAAQASVAYPIAVMVKNSKNALKAAGTVKIALRLKDLVLDGQEALTSSQTKLSLAYDLRPASINREFDTSEMNIKCTFPHAALGKQWTLSQLNLQKAAGSDKVTLLVTVGTFIARQTGPAMTIPAHDFAEFSRSMNGRPSASAIIAFMNKQGAAATQRQGQANWMISGCGLAQQ